MGIGIWQLLIVLVIVLLLFGTKRLRTLGSDLGSSIKGFRSAVKDGEVDSNGAGPNGELEENAGHTIDGEVNSKKDEKV